MNRKHKQKHRPFIWAVLLFSLMKLAHVLHLFLNPLL